MDGTGDSVERIRADHHADTLPEVSLDDLAAWGVTGIVVDLDNTVCAYRRPEPAPGVAAWIRAARDRKFAVVLVSNNFTERVALVGAPGLGQLNLMSLLAFAVGCVLAAVLALAAALILNIIFR